MKDKNEKKKNLEDLKKALAENRNMFVTGYEKMTVKQDFELRKTVREAGGEYQVVKNNLAAKASEGTPAADVLGQLKGMTSLAYTSKDPVALAKALTKYSRENAAFTFKAGIVEGRVIDIAAINDLAAMPPKEAIYAKLLYLINATSTRLVTSVNGVGRNLAVVLDQAVKENKFGQ
ncbi:MAG: 50S ribosomal protein L10 [Acidobacteriaceae bacterium]|nr:50S ribosomal protein L10 [Acidobacteriaceae bacterium]MBV8572338.1 50S ribosomal protein L10 [Acidobacteriaceae bacterium]